MKDGKRIIWSNLNLDLDEWKKSNGELCLDAGEDDMYRMMADDNYGWLECERANLDIRLNAPIICIASLGLWNGRRQGYKMIGSGNVRDCLTGGHDYTEWYVDGEGEFRCTGIHHDGTNYYRYRALTGSESLLTDALYEGRATEEDIRKHTRRIGPIIGKVYGWKFRGRAAGLLAG